MDTATIEAMTPLIKKTQYYWKCQRASCKHAWPAKDITQEPKRCAKCKRLDWNRETKALGRPRKSAKPTRPKGTKPNPSGDQGIGFEAIMKRKTRGTKKKGK